MSAWPMSRLPERRNVRGGDDVVWVRRGHRHAEPSRAGVPLAFPWVLEQRSSGAWSPLLFPTNFGSRRTSSSVGNRRSNVATGASTWRDRAQMSASAKEALPDRPANWSALDHEWNAELRALDVAAGSIRAANASATSERSIP